MTFACSWREIDWAIVQLLLVRTIVISILLWSILLMTCQNLVVFFFWTCLMCFCSAVFCNEWLLSHFQRQFACSHSPGRSDMGGMPFSVIFHIPSLLFLTEVIASCALIFTWLIGHLNTAVIFYLAWKTFWSLSFHWHWTSMNCAVSIIKKSTKSCINFVLCDV